MGAVHVCHVRSLCVYVLVPRLFSSCSHQLSCCNGPVRLNVLVLWDEMDVMAPAHTVMNITYIHCAVCPFILVWMSTQISENVMTLSLYYFVYYLLFCFSVTLSLLACVHACLHYELITFLGHKSVHTVTWGITWHLGTEIWSPQPFIWRLILSFRYRTRIKTRLGLLLLLGM